MTISLKEFAKVRYAAYIDRAMAPVIQETCKKVMERIVKDLNRIADARLVEGEIRGKLSFSYRQKAPLEFALIPSDPVLFKKLEWGEFNDDGTYKTPPHSTLQELKVTVRLS